MFYVDHHELSLAVWAGEFLAQGSGLDPSQYLIPGLQTEKDGLREGKRAGKLGIHGWPRATSLQRQQTGGLVLPPTAQGCVGRRGGCWKLIRGSHGEASFT